jgi:hypothetical protein
LGVKVVVRVTLLALRETCVVAVPPGPVVVTVRQSELTVVV